MWATHCAHRERIDVYVSRDAGARCSASSVDPLTRIVDKTLLVLRFAAAPFQITNPVFQL